MVQPINSQNWVLERNPYFWAIDIEGNQLPYLDKVQLTLPKIPKSSTSRHRRRVRLHGAVHRSGKLPVFLENAARGKYKVHLDPASTARIPN
jgi:hypothetical protein